MSHLPCFTAEGRERHRGNGRAVGVSAPGPAAGPGSTNQALPPQTWQELLGDPLVLPTLSVTQRFPQTQWLPEVRVCWLQSPEALFYEGSGGGGSAVSGPGAGGIQLPDTWSSGNTEKEAGGGEWVRHRLFMGTDGPPGCQARSHLGAGAASKSGGAGRGARLSVQGEPS